MSFLWKGDPGRHVSSCGPATSGFGATMAVPNRLMHYLEGIPQDCLEHVRSGHDAPWVEKTTSIEKYAPPWTVPRQLWLDSLRIEHSGISTDMLLFSEVGMPLTQHYRVYKGGLPHAVFRTDYVAPAVGGVQPVHHEHGH